MNQKCIACALLLCVGFVKTAYTAHKSIIVHTIDLIEDIIRCPRVLADVIVAYLPISPRWIPLLDDVADTYQCYDDQDHWQSFILLEPDADVVKATRFLVGKSEPNARLIINNHNAQIADKYGDDMVEYMYKNSGDDGFSCNIEIVAGSMSVGEQRFRERYGVNLCVMDYLKYMMGCSIQLAARDSDVYQRAHRRTILMMRGDMTWHQLGKCMDTLYNKLKKIDDRKIMPKNIEISKYMQSYKKSAVPCVLRKVNDCGNLQPVLYRAACRQPQEFIPATSGRKRKRS
jgi:hypothetical protein